MKILISRILLALVATSLAGAALAAPQPPTGRLTIAHSWSIEQEALLRQFSAGLGFDVAQRSDAIAFNDVQCPRPR